MFGLALMTWYWGIIWSWFTLNSKLIAQTPHHRLALFYGHNTVIVGEVCLKVHPGCQRVNGPFVRFGGWNIFLCFADFEVAEQKFNFFFFFLLERDEKISLMFLKKASLTSIKLCFWLNFYLLKTCEQDKPGIYRAFATITKFTGWNWSLDTEFKKKMGCCHAHWLCDCSNLTHKGFLLKSLCVG